MIYTISDTLSVSQLKLAATRRMVTRIEIKIPDTDESIQKQLAYKLTRSIRACGCEIGAIFFTATLILFTVLAFRAESPVLEVIRNNVVLEVFALLGSTIAGKAIGLAYAQIELWQTLNKVQVLLQK
jgi:hypothetical protein